MKGKNPDLKSFDKNEDNKIEINIIKEEDIDSKDNNNILSPNLNINTKDKSKENKGNISKNIDNPKNKTLSKNNINENIKNINQRINNFINYSNSNLHNRYYSSNTSNHIFRNFIKKTNYNKNTDNTIENSNNNKIQNYFDNNFQNRPCSFTSRINNNYINKGLNYILDPNNINHKDIIDAKKRDGYDYKKYNRGKRNNYINKKIFFHDNNNQSNLNNINISENNFNNNYPQNAQFLNNYNNINISDFPFYGKNNINNINNRNNMTTSKQNFLHLNDCLILDNLDMNIKIIGNNILNFIENNMSNSIPNQNQNYNPINIEPNTFSPTLKIINPESIDYLKKNSNNIDLNNIDDFNMKLNRNLFFG